MTCIGQYSRTFEAAERSFSDMRQIHSRNQNITNRVTNENYLLRMARYNNIIKKNPRLYFIKPVMLFFGYIKYILQIVNTDKDRIKSLIDKAIVKFTKVMLFSDISGCKIFDLVKCCYSISSTSIDLGLEYDRELLEIIRPITTREIEFHM